MLSVSDVDRDNDLDVVVSGVPSGHTVGVWLNDGHGRFTHADPARFPVADRRPRSMRWRLPSIVTGLGADFAARSAASRQPPTPDAFRTGSFVRGYGTGRPLADISESGRTPRTARPLDSQHS